MNEKENNMLDFLTIETRKEKRQTVLCQNETPLFCERQYQDNEKTSHCLGDNTCKRYT